MNLLNISAVLSILRGARVILLAAVIFDRYKTKSKTGCLMIPNLLV